MSRFWWLVRRELIAYFLSPAAYVVLALFLMLSGFFFSTWVIPSRQADLRPVLSQMALLFLFLAPALTARLWAEERKQGTDELLLTAPISAAPVVMAKYVAVLLLFLLYLAVTFVYPVILEIWSQADWGATLTGYLGLILLGGTALAAGLFASSLTDSQMVAGLLSFVILLAFWMLAWAGGALPARWAPVLQLLSLTGHYGDFAKGVLDSRHVVYFLSLTGGFLFLSVQRLEGARRKARLATLAVFAALVLVNLAAARFPWRLDTTMTRRFSLSPQTLQVLQSLPGPVHAVGFFTAREAALQAYMEDLLQEYRYHSGGLLTWEMADPAVNPSLAGQYGVSRSGVTVLTYQDRQEQVDEWDMLGEFDPFTGQPRLYGEQALTNALLRLTASRTPRVYFVEGHGEPALKEWPDQLRAEGYQQHPLSLPTLPEVPKDADAVVMAGPVRDLSPREVEVLERYLQRGGRMAVLLDPGRRLPVLEEWLRQWGVTVRNDVVVDPARHYLYDATSAVPVYQGHAITQKLDEARVAMVIPSARSLEVDEQREGYRYEPLLTTSTEAWGETRWGEGAPVKDGNDTKGPLTLAVAVTRTQTATETDGSQQAPPEARLLVVGSSGLVTDDGLTFQGNLDFAMAGVAWLTDREEGITIRPRGPDTPPIFLTTAQAAAILAGTTVGIPLLFLAAGGWVWYRRRYL